MFRSIWAVFLILAVPVSCKNITEALTTAEDINQPFVGGYPPYRGNFQENSALEGYFRGADGLRTLRAGFRGNLPLGRSYGEGGGLYGGINRNGFRNSGRNQLQKDFGHSDLKGQNGFRDHFSNQAGRGGQFKSGRTTAFAKEKTISLDQNFGTGAEHQFGRGLGERTGYGHHDRLNNYGRLNQFNQHGVGGFQSGAIRPPGYGFGLERPEGMF